MTTSFRRAGGRRRSSIELPPGYSIERQKDGRFALWRPPYDLIDFEPTEAAAAARAWRIEAAAARNRAHFIEMRAQRGQRDPQALPEPRRFYRGVPLFNRTGRQNDWFIVVGERVRWGTLQQIEDDVDAVIEFGALPPKKSGWF